ARMWIPSWGNEIGRMNVVKQTYRGAAMGCVLKDPCNSITYYMPDLQSAFLSTRVDMRSPSFIEGSRYKRSISALIQVNISSRCYARLVVLIVGPVLWTSITLE